MSITDNTLYEGSFKIVDGVDTSLYGFGDLSVSRNLEILGTSHYKLQILVLQTVLLLSQEVINLI